MNYLAKSFPVFALVSKLPITWVIIQREKNKNNMTCVL
jgi:hypothetical protein